MNTIISKRPSPFIYTKWVKDRGMFTQAYSILVNGGAGVLGGLDFLSGKKQDNFSLITPEGVATLVDDDTLNRLMDIKQFQKDIERGLIKVIQKKSIKDQDKIDEIASDKMIPNDEIGGRPITKEDMKMAGAIENADGSWNVTNARGDINYQRKNKKRGKGVSKK